MLAVTTIVPFGLALTTPTAPPESPPSRMHRALVLLLPIDAACGILGWTEAPGERLAIACAGVHLLVGAGAALHGVGRLASRRAARFGPPQELAFDVGLLLLPVGAAWLFATRAAMTPLGFEEPVVTFTAAHFHYAGFAAPTVLGGVGRLLHARDERTSLPYRVAVLAVCAGVPLTAIGISTTHAIEVASAILLACGMLVATALVVVVATRRAWPISRAAAILLGASGLALVGTMALAATFATTSSAGHGSSLEGAVPITTMIDLHGGGNALGFALSGLVALTLLDRRR